MWGPRHSSVTEESESFKVSLCWGGCGCGCDGGGGGGGGGGGYGVGRILLPSTISRICVEPCPVLLAAGCWLLLSREGDTQVTVSIPWSSKAR